ncbi:hypothetical protein HBI81_192460 [Parastagonospora nodorum]|nr:hypothetical protein HBI09_187280 [Parastagonospora nodorum]KAH4087214.1 hypothetical protein HBH46_201420 [Parastagonospora nodorum]KAH4216700.1 hypothetical protein HBI06_227490 [Parastagonospora nodorum]KAH4225576.1 hypothetical protein HBI05_226120 [Parastagonospora nodorum]KAH4994486.1 hypothetical protein HBI77_208650 [Parastagonospora nodorum]
MDVQKAAELTVSALTLKEKTLAKDLLYSEQYHKDTLSAWIRAPVLNLKQALEKTRTGANQAGFKARFFNVFCDVLEIDPGTEVLPEKAGEKSVPYEINLYARRLDYTPTSGSAVHVRFEKDCEIFFWTSKLPGDFSITFDGQGLQRQKYAPKIEGENFGVILRLEQPSAGISSEPLLPPDEAMNNINYLNLIDDNGKLRSKAYLNDDLPRLLQFQLLVAQTHTTLNRSLAVDLLNYVVAATADPRAAAIHFKATAMLSSLLVDSSIVAAPSVNIYASEQILKSRLTAALAFEQAFRDFSLEASNRKVQTQTAVDLLRKSQDAIQTYAFIKDIRQREYDNAVVANAKAQKTFQANQANLSKLGANFQAGVEEWKEAEKEKAAKEVLKGLVMVGLAIGATIATGGAAAATIPAAGAAVVNTASKIATLIAKLKQIYEKIKEIYEKIKPVIEKLQEVVKTITEVIATLRKFDGATTGTKTLKLSADSNDVFNATAEWRRFDITIREMEDSLREYKIRGKEEYFHDLKILVPNGECFILTQANLVKTGDELATVLIQSEAERRSESRLSSTALSVTTDLDVLDVLVRAMFDRVLTIRSLVYLDFLTYSSAQEYHTLSKGPVVTLSPVKPVVDYLEDIVKLQSAVVSFGSQVLVQQRSFTLNTLAGFADASKLAEAITDGQALSVAVRPGLELFQDFGRIRLSRARCFLDGAKLSSTAGPQKESLPLRIELHTESQFFDLPLEKRVQPELGPVIPRVFLGASRKVLFEYSPSDNSTACDGWYGQERDYTKFTPLTNWVVKITGGGYGTLSVADLDLSGLKGLRLEFLCDFSLR